MKDDFKKVGAFTLAETLITLTILGVVAAITVPNMVRKQVERTNRTKIKKALAAYESALNKMMIENDLKSQSQLSTFMKSNDCENTKKYFKQVEGSGCFFKTGDGVYWKILGYPTLVSVKKVDDTNYNFEKKATDENDKTAFTFVYSIDNSGNLRVMDLGYEKTNPVTTTVIGGSRRSCTGNSGSDYRYNYVAEVYDFINGEKTENKVISCYFLFPNYASSFCANKGTFLGNSEYYSNGKIKKVEGYSDDGTGGSFEYYENGKLKSKTTVSVNNGNETKQVYTYYDDDGTRADYYREESVTTYYNGELNGKYEYYTNPKQKKSELQYTNYKDANGDSLLSKKASYNEDGTFTEYINSKISVSGNTITTTINEYLPGGTESNPGGLKSSTEYKITSGSSDAAIRKTTSYHEDGTTEKEKITYHTSDAANGSYKAGDIQSHYIYNEQGSNTYRKNVFGEYKYEYDTNGTTLLRTYKMNNTTGEWELQ